MKYILGLLLLLFLNSCLDLRNCNANIVGKYICSNMPNSTNFIKIKKDGTFLHYYKKNNIVLISQGTWEKSTDGYCKIELSEWKNFNEYGENFDEFGNGILFINGLYLDISSDGNSSSSFLKER
jgi:hypothetical protein